MKGFNRLANALNIIAVINIPHGCARIFLHELRRRSRRLAVVDTVKIRRLAFFRQKRDGGPDLWVEGYAVRMEHDGKTDVSKLFTRARLKRLDGTKVTDEVEGEFISYDAKTEFYSVNNTSSGVSRPGEGRIKVVIQPRDDKKTRGKDKNPASARDARAVPAPANGGENSKGK